MGILEGEKGRYIMSCDVTCDSFVSFLACSRDHSDNPLDLFPFILITIPNLYGNALIQSLSLSTIIPNPKERVLFCPCAGFQLTPQASTRVGFKGPYYSVAGRGT
jgi:hypothetical protein